MCLERALAREFPRPGSSGGLRPLSEILMLHDKKIRCVLVHDHILLRQGLRRLLEDEPDIEVVAEAANPGETLQRAFELRPDVVIADVNAFALPAASIERLVHQGSPQSEVVFLTAGETEDPKLRLARAEGNCAAQHTSAEELVNMVRGVVAAKGAVQFLPNRAPQPWTAEAPPPKWRELTSREREVLKLLAEGRTVRSAADVLGLSVKTVDAHKFNLMRKLGVHNKAELVMWAIQKRLVKIPASSQA